MVVEEPQAGGVPVTGVRNRAMPLYYRALRSIRELGPGGGSSECDERVDSFCR